MVGVRSSLWMLVFGGLTLACGRTSKSAAPEVSGPSGSAGKPSSAPNAPNCAVSLAGDGTRFCAVYEDGSVWCWGNEAWAEPPTDPSPLRVAGLGQASRVFMGRGNVCVQADGGLHCWGSNSHRELDDSGERIVTPVAVALGTNGPVQGVGFDNQHLCAVDALSHVYCRGGELDAPVQVTAGDGLLAHLPGPGTEVFDGQGRVFSLDSPQSPRLLAGLGSGNQSLSGGTPACVLKRAGSLWCTDYLFDTDDARRAHVALAESVVQAGASDLFVCALTDAGRVWCEGYDKLGQAGRGTRTDFAAGGYVSAFEDARYLSVAYASACALRVDGSVWCWGTFLPDQKDVAPREVTSCQGQRTEVSLPRPSGPVKSSGRLAEAGRARAQAVCECAFGLSVEKSCLEEENFSAHAACLEALAPNDPAWDCRAKRAWQEAQCFGQGSCSNGTLPDCADLTPCEEEERASAVASYCRRRNCSATSESVAPSALCDGTADCADGSDERNCTPAQVAFQCGDEATTSLSRLCDGALDCADGSDEAHCP